MIDTEGDSGGRSRGRILAILHNGSMESADYLHQVWAPLNGVVERAPGRYVIPWLEAGEYAVCETNPFQLDQVAISGTVGEACSRGYLPAGGELILDLSQVQ